MVSIKAAFGDFDTTSKLVQLVERGITCEVAPKAIVRRDLRIVDDDAHNGSPDSRARTSASESLSPASSFTQNVTSASSCAISCVTTR